MLHRSFKPAKCKTALKLAASRMKLLKNKKEAQLKQLKRELALLLQSGQDRTAMIRVEHVVREEKTLSAYELIEIYCELIVARLPIIESQKNCPIDLKEAIASVVFASPRCADVPELMDVRKQFSAKYGKEFVSAAVELRPDCGVGRMLIEKLSVKAPDGPTKIKILKSIAEEHDIKWDPSAENDPTKPPEDLLNGPSNMHMDPPNAHVRSGYDGRGPSSHGEKPDISANIYDHNKNSAQYTQSDASTDMATNRASVSGTSNPEARPHGNGNEVKHSYSGNGLDSSSGGQNWKMEFKDAAEAAQAAAESADRASMAARAAAELSGHANLSMLNSPETHGSYGSRDDLPNRYSSSNFEDQHVAEDQVHKVQSEQINETEQDHRSTDKSNQPSLFDSRASSFHDDHMVNSSQVADMYSENNSSRPGRSDFAGEMSFDKPSSEVGSELESEELNDVKSENIDYPVEVQIRTPSRTYSHDHDNVVLIQNNAAGENPFAEGNFHDDTEQTVSHDKGPLVFDESGSDEEEEVLDTHQSTNINAWSPRQNVSHPVFTESSPVDDSLSDDLLPVTFDDYNGPSYESEEELEESRHVRTTEVPTSISEHRSSFVDDESESDIKLLSQPFSNDTDSLEAHLSDDHPEIEEISPALQPSRSSSQHEEVKDKLNPSQVSDTITDTEVTEESKSVSELSLGKLTGGLRNKGYRLPPFNRNVSGNALLSKQAAEDTSSRIGQTSSSPRVKNSVGSGSSEENEKSNSRTSRAHLDYDSGEETLKQEHSNNMRIAGNQAAASSRSPLVHSGSDDSDSGENLPKQTAITKPGTGIGVSRRTKAAVLSGKEVVATNHDAERIETSVEPHLEAKSSFHIGDLDWARKMAEPVSKPIQDSNRPSQRDIKVQEPVFEPLPESDRLSQKGKKAQELVFEPLAESNMPSQKERKVEEVSKPFPESNRPSQKERKVQEPVFEPLPESYRPFQKEKKVQEPFSNPIQESNRPFLKERKVAEPASKPFPESYRPSQEESLKSTAMKQPSNSLPKRVPSGTSKSVKTSSLNVTESQPKEKPSHVHPNLPDIDAITAHLQSLRNNR